MYAPNPEESAPTSKIAPLFSSKVWHMRTHGHLEAYSQQIKEILVSDIVLGIIQISYNALKRYIIFE